MITIYNREGVALLSPQYRDESHYTRRLMGEHHVRLRFDWHETIALPYGSYIEALGQRWYVWASYMPAQRDGVAVYDVAFHAPEVELENFTAFYMSGGAMEAEWSLTGTLYQFALEIRGNLERIGSPLSIDPEAYRDHAQAKHIDLSKESIADLLGKVAEAFDIEWWCDAGGGIHLGKLEQEKALTARLGELAQSYSPQGEGNPLISRLYAFGAKRNLPTSYRTEGAQAVSRIAERRLQLPQQTPYIIGASLGVEQVEYFEDVYPRYEGTITAVTTRQSKDDTIYKIVDPDLHISKSYILEGQTLRAQFTSGALQGMDFDLSISSDGYEIVPNDSYGLRLPSGLLVPSVGDRYVPYGFDISMVGAEYVERAEAELLQRATEWLEQNNEDRRDVEVECDPTWIYQHGTDLQLGRAMILEGATPTGDKIGRITRIEFPLYCPEAVTLVVGNAKPLGTLERVRTEAKAEAQGAKTLAREEAQRAVSIARRGMDEALQSMEQVEELFDEQFGQRLEASTLRSMQIVLGDPLLQYRFVRGTTDTTPIPMQYSYHTEGKTLSIPTSYIQHASLGAEEGAHTMQGGRGIDSLPVFTLEPFRSPSLDFTDRTYYLYLHLEQGGSYSGRFALYAERQSVDALQAHHTLLVGVLGAEDEVGARAFTPLHGYTEILPNQIRTERIVSSDARTWFDLEAGHIHGRLTMTDSMGESVLSSSTEISGGLVLSQTIGARDREGAVRSYISGRADKPAFSAGVTGYDTTSEEASARINHDGTAHFGQMHLLGDRIEVRGKQDQSPYLRLGGQTQTLDELTTTKALQYSRELNRRTLKYTTYTDSPERPNSTPSNHYTETLLEGFTITQGGYNLEVRLALSIGNVRQSADIRLSLETESGAVIRYWSQDVPNWGSRTLTIEETITAVPAGAYRLRLETFTSYVTPTGAQLGTSELDTEDRNGYTYIDIAKGRLVVKDNRGIYETVYGRSGFYSYYSDRHLLYFGEGGLHVRGAVDLPGLLASGRVEYATASRLLRLAHNWGARSSSKAPTIGSGGSTTDLITIYHNVGHTNYSVQITPAPNSDRNMRAMASVIDHRANSFTMYITDAYNHTRTDIGFSFAIFGANN